MLCKKIFDSADDDLIVPITILLHDLALIEEQPDKYEDTQLINFGKFRQVYGVYKQIERTKKSIFPFVSVSLIQDFLANQVKPLSDVELLQFEKTLQQNSKLPKRSNSKAFGMFNNFRTSTTLLTKSSTVPVGNPPTPPVPSPTLVHSTIPTTTTLCFGYDTTTHDALNQPTTIIGKFDG